MKIVAPLSNIDTYETMVEAGADEFFCGVIPYGWLQDYHITAMNRREFMFRNSNICNMSSMRILSRKIEETGVPVKITMNSLYYTTDKYPHLVNLIRQLTEIGIDTFIIADVALILYLREKGIPCNIHLSGEASPLNRLNINFYGQFEISRYVFPRKTTIPEMKSCIESITAEGVTFEAFILNALCSFTGAFCSSLHCERRDFGCAIPYRTVPIHQQTRKFTEQQSSLPIVDTYERDLMKKIKNKEQLMKPSLNNLGVSGCGLCRLPELKEAGVTHLKVVGRGEAQGQLLFDIRSLKEIIAESGRVTDKKEFARKVKDNYFKGSCPSLCYYPA